ncbi:hypothetical protein BH11MYX1_BH11MYX1_16270 [soil metagenome]
MRNLLAALLFATACGSAYADQPMGPGGYAAGTQIAIDVAPAKVRAPYDVQVVKESGETLPTYASHDRFYVQGNSGERYTIKISNPTGHRVEAVVSVDGLDAVDGEAGDLHKRGYIVPPYGETRIEGFRTSLDNVATFRFSSVDGSYAGQKGKARNVGVIAVALFEEEHAPDQQIVAPERYDYTDDLDEGRVGAAGAAPPRDRVAKADRAMPPARKAPGDGYRYRPAPAAPAAPAPTTTATAGAAHGAARPHYEEHIDADDSRAYDQGAAEAAPTSRPGLGTEFGEARYSAANYTKFTRSTTNPLAIAELRYNDASGLMALGISVQPMPDQNELMVRETADPFPGDHFARSPR